MLKRMPLNSRGCLQTLTQLTERRQEAASARKRPSARVEMAGVEPASRKFGCRCATSLFGLLILARDHLDRRS